MSTLVHEARGTITMVVMIMMNITTVVMTMVSITMVVMIMVSITRGATYFSGANSGGDTQWDQIW